MSTNTLDAELLAKIRQKKAQNKLKRSHIVEDFDEFDIESVTQPDSDSDEQEKVHKKARYVATNEHIQCPYLDTINRQLLDFDFEKLCSISLSRINVYACLVCGKYFQGRGNNTHAYTHSIAEGHHVFLNLNTLKFYCLPEKYEIIDSSLDDIKYVLNPTFTENQIKQLDSQDGKMSRAIDGSLYWPGVVGLNNIKANDYCNVVLQCLCQIKPVRNYFLREENYANVKRATGDTSFLLVQRFGELMRKLWNDRNFKTHVSPHEMLQAVVLWSKKRFQFTVQGDPIDFLSWFLNALHIALNGTKKINSSIIYKTFLGHMRVHTRKIPPVDLDDLAKSQLLATPEYMDVVTESPFLYLTCDLPPPPLFKDEISENIIPQVTLSSLLEKFNNINEKEYKTYKDNFLKKFEITKLPRYLIVFIKRFTKNTFFTEKNPTIVNFPVKNIDFGDYLSSEAKKLHKNTNYNLVANIVHDGTPDKGTYRVHILHKVTGKWFEIQDLHVVDILPQMITLSEAYIQVYELADEAQS